PTNKAGQPAAESVEPSAEAEGNASQQAATSSRDAGPRHEEVLRRCGSRHTSTGCGRRSRKTPPALPSWSPKRAVTRWCHNPPPGPPAACHEANARTPPIARPIAGWLKMTVCLLPGTEIAFDENVECEPSFGVGVLANKKIGQQLARFRQINMHNPVTHHDALEFPDGHVVLLSRLCEGQRATVLQLPAAARPEAAKERATPEVHEPSLSS